MNERICIVCKKSLANGEWGPDNAVVFVGNPGYGSTFDSVLQELDSSWPKSPAMRDNEEFGDASRNLTIVICDPCLSADKDAVAVEHTFVAKRVTRETTKWSASDAPEQWRKHQSTKRKERKP